MSSRLIVVSNRLPVSVREENGTIRVDRSSGGLVTGLDPIVSKTGGCWIGWPGAELSADVLHALNRQPEQRYRLVPVSLSTAEVADYYHGCANSALWPLFHGFPTNCRFDPNFWDCYQHVNDRFADAIRAVATPRDFVWVHDYHLMSVASSLLDCDCRLKVGYFHHIPFPDPDTFGKLPWRREILEGLLNFNVVGFQTVQDKRNFVSSLKRYLPTEISLRRIGSSYLICADGAHTTVGSFPISIDFRQFDQADSERGTSAVAELRQKLCGQKILIGVDRLDYTKGIPERLAAYDLLLKQHPELLGKVHLIQLVVPSREDVPQYAALRQEIERKVSNINGQFGRVGWSPVTYLHQHLSQAELIALYRAADVALVTPLRDGMNLVSKEFCASRQDERGVLILSEFAGAAAELICGAVLVNPYDVNQVMDAIKAALTLPSDEIRRRMRLMRDQVKCHDVWRWSAAFRATRGFQPQLLPDLAPVRQAFAASQA